MHKITPEILRAWADGELSPQRNTEISALIAGDEELARQADYFEASKLPFKAAMNLDHPPVPAELQAQILQWSRIAKPPDLIKHNERPTGSTSGKKRVYRVALAAAVLLLIISGFGIITHHRTDDPVTEWVKAVVTYQRFYVAETIRNSTGDQVEAEHQLVRLNQQDPAFPDTPPTLEKLGYKFKRLQQLDFNGQPVLQMVFYKPGKRPLAICLMPDKTAIDEQFTKHGPLNSYAWQYDKLWGVVVAEEDITQLKAVIELVHNPSPAVIQGRMPEHQPLRPPLQPYRS